MLDHTPAAPLTEAHPLARPYLAGSALCPMGSGWQGFEGVGGRVTTDAAHFRVHERLTYPPSGEGAHALALVMKEGRTTEEAVSALAAASGVVASEIGYAGRKDKSALTTQWVTLPCAPERVRSEDPQVVVISAAAHGQKLKLGNLSGNVFSIFLSDLARPALLGEGLSLLRGEGLPNYFGPQRFGKTWYPVRPPEGYAPPLGADGLPAQDPHNIARDNVDRALALLSAPPRGGKGKTRDAQLLLSSLQSALFNLWLGERVRDGLAGRVIEGDVCRKVTGGTFTSSEPEVDTARLERGEIEVLGPLVGPKLFPARGEALAREESLYERWGLTPALRAAMGKAWRGDRRAATLRPLGLRARFEREAGDAQGGGAQGVWLHFALPSGAFATTLLGALVDPRALFRREEAQVTRESGAEGEGAGAGVGEGSGEGEGEGEGEAEGAAEGAGV
jgi:tRNA pseudouridine13 synthase